MSETLAFESALEQARLIREREVSPVELVQLYADRISDLNPRLNAYITLCLDRAMDEAKRAEADVGEGTSQFYGVPISIKDLNETAGVRTTFGTATYSDHIPERDDIVVAKLREAGFIVLGKTNTPEFGTTPWTEPPAYGVCRNPWDPERTSGGSSGGAASALAAGLCPVSQGSDGGGSIRIPASSCGLFGIKPSRGRVSAPDGASSLLSQNGPIARTVADAAAVLDILSGYESGDAWTAIPAARPFSDEVGADPGRLRIAFTTKPMIDVPVDESIAACAKDVADELAAAGHEVVEIDPPYPDPTSVFDLFLKLWATGQAAAMDPLPPLDTLDPLNKALVEMAEGVKGYEVLNGLARLEKEIRPLVRFFDQYDLLVTTVSASSPPKHGEGKMEGNPLMEFISAANFVPNTAVWNLTGQPAVSVPIGLDANGMPAGTQIIGRPFDEATLIRVASQLEKRRPWAGMRPGIS